MNKFYSLMVSIMTLFSAPLYAISVTNGGFSCSCSTYNYCNATGWTHQNLNSAFAYCQTAAHSAGGGEVNDGDGFFILGDGTTTYQDITLGNLGEYNVSYREAEHPGASGSITLEYLNSSKNILKTTTKQFTFPFVYIKDGGTGQLSGIKTLNGGTTPTGTKYARIKLYGTKGTVGFAKVDDIKLNYIAPPPPAAGKNISGTVFHDQNHNGIKEAFERGMHQSTYVKLCQSNNRFISSTPADPTTGSYSFTNIAPGNYILLEDASNTPDCSSVSDVTGWLSTTPNILSVGLNNTNLQDQNFGNYHGSTLSGYVFNDLDKDGHFDQGTEVGMANIGLLIKRCGEIEFDHTTTDTNGAYTFWIPVGVQGDYAVDNWIAVFEKNAAGAISTDAGFVDDFVSTGDEFNNGVGTQTEPANGSNTDHNWLCFQNIAGLDFDNGGYQLVSNNFGNYVQKPHTTPTVVAEYRFDCPNEWMKDYSIYHNDATGTVNNIDPFSDNDDATMHNLCQAAQTTVGYTNTVKINHINAYELTAGTISLLFYDHHNVWNKNATPKSLIFSKGTGNNRLEIEVHNLNNIYQGTVSVNLKGNKLEGTETYFHTQDGGGTYDHDTQWVHAVVSFGADGLKLYINGVLKQHDSSVTADISNIMADIEMANLSGYYDEFYMFQGQMSDAEVQRLTDNIRNNLNLDGTPRDCNCDGNTASVRGRFNIERTDSGSDPINSDARNAWYTQISGRDFDYALVAYEEDMSAEKLITNVTLKVELINHDNNSTLYTRHLHIPATTTQSHFDIISGSNAPTEDLSIPIAAKDARFRISYPVDTNGDIVQADCDTSVTTAESCFNSFSLTRSDDALDNFAIRPENFYMVLSDTNQTRRISRDPINLTTPLRVAAGYDYTLDALATQYRSNNTVEKATGYTTHPTRSFIFQDPTNPNCQDRTEHNTSESFVDGSNHTKLMELQNVGHYLLHLSDNSWTAVDAAKATPECIPNNSDTSSNGNRLSGCDIVSLPDLNLFFYPYQFDLNFTNQNLPSDEHEDFIYMSELNSTYNDVAIQFQGDITAQSQDGITTTNFTDGCVAQNVLLALDATTLSEDGVDTLLQTSPHHTRPRTPVFWTLWVTYNDENTTLDIDTNIDRITTPLPIDKQMFLDDRNGTTHLELRYNVNKNIAETINPVQVTFHSFDADSADAHSEANHTTLFIPKGHQDLGNFVRNFYFSQVAPDEKNYPRVHFSTNPTIITPLNIDIFCDKNSSYCQLTNVFNHTTLEGSPRAQEGWYLSIDHNQTIDGNVTALTPMPPIVTTSPNPSAAFPILFTAGRNGIITTTFLNCSGVSTESMVYITPTPTLLYNPNAATHGEPTYRVSCTPNESNTWSGIGETGNIVDTESNEKRSNKIDW